MFGLADFNLQAVTAFALLLIAFISFIRLLVLADTNERLFQKIVGGMAVFVIALIANNTWVYCLALFIGGLIIASEDFMRFLVAVVRTRNDKISDTVNALLATKATPKEIDEKAKEEETDRDLNKDEENLNDNSKKTQRLAKIKNIEDRVQEYLKNKFSNDYESQISLSDGKNKMVVDGIRKNKAGLSQIVEIKVITPKSFPNLKYLISNFRNKLSRMGLSDRIPLLFIIVSEEITLENAQEMHQENYLRSDLMFFKWENDSLTHLPL